MNILQSGGRKHLGPKSIKKRHASIFQIHGARKGLGWAGPGVRWGGRGGMVSTSLLLINTGKSSQKHIIISFRRRRIGGVEEKKERKHLKQARLYVLCIAALQNTKINKSQGFVKWMWCFNSFGLAGEATTSSEGTKVNWIKKNPGLVTEKISGPWTTKTRSLLSLLLLPLLDLSTLSSSLPLGKMFSMSSNVGSDFATTSSHSTATCFSLFFPCTSQPLALWTNLITKPPDILVCVCVVFFDT